MTLRRLLGLAALTATWALALGLVPGTGAGAVELDSHGWWWRAQTGLNGTEVPPPPNVPDDGLAVGAAPDGATALAALRYDLAPGDTSPVLTLTVADNGGFGDGQATLAACPPQVRWSAAQAGRWDRRPVGDCLAASVQGIRSDDGATWTFPVAPLVDDGSVDIVIVPGAQTPDGAPTPGFQIAFDPPGPDALAVTVLPVASSSSTSSSSTTSTLPLSTATTPPASGGSDGFIPSFSAGTPVPATGPSVETFVPAEGGGNSAGQAYETAAAPLDPASDRGRALGVALLAGTAVAAGLAGRQPQRAPRLLGAVTAGRATATPPPEPEMGGLGRFSRPRHGSPPPLL